MNAIQQPAISVLCVDDNEHVAQALRVKFELAGGLDWKGWLAAADELIPAVRRECPAVVLLDIDMPGRDPFDALSELSGVCPNTRCVVFSGHVRRELIDRALEAGAWAYISKNDGEDALLSAIHRVSAGEFVLSPEVRTVWERA